MDITTNIIDKCFEEAKHVIVKAGTYIEETKKTGYKVIRKELRELVTEVDVNSQDIIVSHLSKNTACKEFHTEETRINEHSNDLFWIIDPLDGTHNYIAGLPFYGVSIALAVKEKIEFGIIYFPYSEEIFYARKGLGAFKNNERIQVSSNDSLEKSIIAYDNQFHKSANSLDNFLTIQQNVFTTRILGVATRDACFVSEGVIDARIWNNTKLCDVAAGEIIVKEAGGKATDFSGRDLNLFDIKDVVISSGKFHDEILSNLKV